jgi:hypothetical protein
MDLIGNILFGVTIVFFIPTVVLIYIWLQDRRRITTEAATKLTCECCNCGWIERLNREYGLSLVGTQDYICPLCGNRGVITENRPAANGGEGEV